MSKISATIVADSINPQGDRLTSVLVTFPRILLSEVNTHRMLSKNTSSSRAIPFNKMVEAVQNNPFIPIAWQKDHKGMQGTEYWTDDDTVTVDKGDEYERYTKIYSATEHFITKWLEARDLAIAQSYELNRLEVTKQLCNRLLEPFMWTTMLITGSREGWENFFSLRNPVYEYKEDVFNSKKDAIKSYTFEKGFEEDKKYLESLTDLDWLKLNKGQAEIHMMALAEKIYDAVNESTPKKLKAGEWHIPFEDKIDTGEIRQLADSLLYGNVLNPNEDFNKILKKATELKIKISTAMAAHTSYTTVGNEPVKSYEKWIELHDKLIAYEPPHCFTEGTEILTNEGWKFFKDLTKEELIASVDTTNGKFIGFSKPTSFIEDDYEGKVYTYKTKNIDISVTPNHKLLGISVSKYSDRSRSYDTLEIIEPQQKISDTKTLGERELIMFSAPKEVVVDNLKMYKEGQLLGFFLGDGSARYKNSIRFRLKKERKKSYIINLLQDLDINYTIYLDSKDIYNIKADVGDYSIYYDENYNKRIPENILSNIINHVDFIAGLFDGLKNSDGNIKRNTWVYDTFSTPLKENILFLCPLIGLTGVENPSYNHHRISFLTNNRILLNDSRKLESKVLIEDYKGKIYCVETPSNGIIVRKNGKVLITHNSSPFEHCCQVPNQYEYDMALKEEEKGWFYNLKGFKSYRYMIDNNLEI